MSRRKLSSLTQLAIALAALAVVLFLVSGLSGNHSHGHGARQMIGDASWFGFLISLLALVIVGVFALFRRVYRARTQGGLS